MSLCGPFRRIGDREPPRAYGGCHCSCHRTVGMVHVAACCGPGRGDTLLEEPICRMPSRTKCCERDIDNDGNCDRHPENNSDRPNAGGSKNT